MSMLRLITRLGEPPAICLRSAARPVGRDALPRRLCLRCHRRSLFMQRTKVLSFYSHNYKDFWFLWSTVSTIQRGSMTLCINTDNPQISLFRRCNVFF